MVRPLKEELLHGLTVIWFTKVTKVFSSDVIRFFSYFNAVRLQYTLTIICQDHWSIWFFFHSRFMIYLFDENRTAIKGKWEIVRIWKNVKLCVFIFLSFFLGGGGVGPWPTLIKNEILEKSLLYNIKTRINGFGSDFSELDVLTESDCKKKNTEPDQIIQRIRIRNLFVRREELQIGVFIDPDQDSTILKKIQIRIRAHVKDRIRGFSTRGSATMAGGRGDLIQPGSKYGPFIMDTRNQGR